MLVQKEKYASMRESHEKIKYFSYVDGFEFKTIYFSALSFVKNTFSYGNEYETTNFIVPTMMKGLNIGYGLIKGTR
jgi:hypothetical protein